jgi:CubicO group peptidase (beta-lactamase class C family)
MLAQFVFICHRRPVVETNHTIDWQVGALARLALGMAILACSATTRPTVAAEENFPSQFQPDQFVTSWLLLGPISISGDSPDETVQRAAFDADQLVSAGGAAGIAPKTGTKTAIGDQEYEWRFVSSSGKIVDLKKDQQPQEFSIYYAWTEFDLPQKLVGLCGIGSDDSIKVWINGKLVHQNWTDRAVRPDEDVVPFEFSAGRNHVLLKVQNKAGSAGFAFRFFGPVAQAERLAARAHNGDIEGVQWLLDHGVDINGRSRNGLTAVQIALLHGRKPMVEFLTRKGADASYPIPPRERLVDALLSDRFNDHQPGAAVLVAQNGTILFEKGYGLASVEHLVPITADTKFRIGSITKQFTAAAILKLLEEGKLSLDDPLSKFIPDYPRGGEVSIRHLLTHTSGIHSYTSKPDFLASATVGATIEDHIGSFKNDPYDFDPGQKFLYNNSGYFLLGFIIEKVSGRSYDDYLREAFFEPLGMKNTGVHTPTAILQHEATGYAFEDGTWKKAIDWDMSKAGAAGALYSTVKDLHLWNEALFAGKILSEASLNEAFTPVTVAGEDAAQPKETGYGFGWSIQKPRGSQEISHAGGLNGFVSFLMRLPAEKFTVVMLVNSAPTPPGYDPVELSHAITELVLGDQLAPRTTPDVDVNVSTDAIVAIVGRYDYGAAIMTVTREGNQVFAQLSGQPKFPIFPKSETSFFWKVVEAEITFVKDADGKVTKAIHKQNGQTIDAPRIEDIEIVDVDPQLFDAYVGKYDYGAGKSIMTITRNQNQLFAQLTGQPKFEIFPASENEFVWKVVNARITFVKDDSGKVVKAIHSQSGRTFDAPKLD